MQGTVIVHCNSCGQSVALQQIDTADDPLELGHEIQAALLKHRNHCEAQRWN